MLSRRVRLHGIVMRTPIAGFREEAEREKETFEAELGKGESFEADGDEGRGGT